MIALGNPARGLDAHQGAVLLHDGETGQLRALLNASAITEIRTAAVSGGRDARARAPGRERRRDPRRRRPGALARRGDARGPRRTPRSGRGRGATAARPSSVLAERRRRLHVHERPRADPAPRVAGAGRARERRRLEHPERRASSTPRRSRPPTLVVDRRESALNEAGDLLLAGLRRGAHRAPSSARCSSAPTQGERTPHELTVFKSLGLGVEDLAAAELVVRKAREQGVGTEVEF